MITYPGLAPGAINGSTPSTFAKASVDKSGLAVEFNPREFDTIPNVIYEHLGELSSTPFGVSNVDIV